LGNFYRGFGFGMDVLRGPVRVSNATVAVQRRLASRQDSFLRMVEHGIFAHAPSPYRPLLDTAGYDLARIRALVARTGVEEALRTLCVAGVYVSFEEAKGIREARRGARTFRFKQEDFLNPFGQSGLRTSSSGSRGRPRETWISAADRHLVAEHLALALAAYGLNRPAVAVWYHDVRTNLGVTLLFATLRNAPFRRLTQIPVAGVDRAFNLGVDVAALLRGVVLRPRTHVPLGEEWRMLPWFDERRGGGGYLIDTSASSALRLALAADRQGKRLTDVTFLTSGEPLTPRKAALIRASGARAFSYYSFSEFGRAAFGCASPASADDAHVCRDILAMITRRRAADYVGTEVDALLVTALLPDARRILLNAETGDYARLTRRTCGCLLEEIGWPEHVEEIRSFEKLTPEGDTLLGSRLISLLEEILPARFGGDPTDYQMLEQENREGFTRLTVMVHPRLGRIDEGSLLDCVWSTLRAGNTSILLTKAGTIAVRRAVPIVSGGVGKLLPLHRLPPENQIQSFL
jgi:hypothetical protein